MLAFIGLVALVLVIMACASLWLKTVDRLAERQGWGLARKWKTLARAFYAFVSSANVVTVRQLRVVPATPSCFSRNALLSFVRP